jgi:hypothetical protein
MTLCVAPVSKSTHALSPKEPMWHMVRNPLRGLLSCHEHHERFSIIGIVVEVIDDGNLE